VVLEFEVPERGCHAHTRNFKFTALGTMKITRASVAFSFVPLVLLAFLRIAGARWITTAIPAPYGAAMVSAVGVLAVVAIAVVVDRLVRYFYWDGYLRRKRKRETPALIEDILTIALLAYRSPGCSPRRAPPRLFWVSRCRR
jgi:hypothetical protein